MNKVTLPSFITGLICLVTILSLAQTKQKTILFVCEHGTAKSIVAAAHFKKMAEQEGVSINIVSRGTNPDEVVPEKINKLLHEDGFPSYTAKPVQLTSTDLKTADYVIAFNPIPDKFGKTPHLETWNIPSFEAGYPIARDSILIHIERIIQRIKEENKK